MQVVVTGATGMIGRALVAALRARGDTVVALSRDERRGRRRLGDGVEVHEWRAPTRTRPPAEALAGAAAVVHLIGEHLDQRWTAEAKRAIRDSRVLSTRMLVDGLRALGDHERPATLVAQSATGFYGARDEEPVDEEAPAGRGFLAAMVADWEREARPATPLVRVVWSRTGVVLSPQAGALARMLPFFRLGVGGPVAGGRHYLPWIHPDDVVAGLLACLDDERIEGPVNLTAPNPVTNAELSRTLGRVLRRPAVLPVPALALRLLYGERAELVTVGQRAVPARLRALGHDFRQPDLEPALRDVLARG